MQKQITKDSFQENNESEEENDNDESEEEYNDEESEESNETKDQSIGEKKLRCGHCKQMIAESLFTSQKRWCKPCKSAWGKERELKKKNKTLIKVEDVIKARLSEIKKTGYKTCNRCHQTLELEKFKQTYWGDGRLNQCRSCAYKKSQENKLKKQKTA